MASRESNYDHHITIFSPQGHIYQMEYAMKAAMSGTATAIAVRGTDSCAFVIQKKIPDRLIDPTSVTSIFKITPHIGCLMIGLAADCHVQSLVMRNEAQQFKYKYGYEMPCSALASRMSDLNQLYTQKPYFRTLACIMLLIGIGENGEPELFKLDCNGHFFPYFATAIGQREAEGQNWLEKKLGAIRTANDVAVTETAIAGLQHVLLSDFRSQELEVGVIRRGEEFRTLSQQNIEDHLTAIHSREED